MEKDHAHGFYIKTIKNNQKHAITKKNMSVALHLIIKVIMPTRITLNMTLGIRV
jgi:hypothetical protein